MKTIIAYLPCHILYFLGDIASKILGWSRMEQSEKWAEFWYPVYNRLMLWSVRLNDYGNLDVWGKKNEA